MPDSAELQAWSKMFAGTYTSGVWSGSPQEFIRFSTSARNDPEYLRFYQALGARSPGERVKLEIENLGPDGALGALSFGGKSHHLKPRGGIAPRMSGTLEYGQGAINFAAEGNAAELTLWFWSSNFVEAPEYPDVISIHFKRDKSSAQGEHADQVFAQGGFTFRYPIGWTVVKEKSRLRIRPDRWFGDSVLQIICFETHGSGQAAVAPVLDALVQLMTANSKDQAPKSVGKIKTAHAFGKAGSLISFEQMKLNEQGQCYETRIRTFVVFHEDVAVVLWAEGGPDGVKQRDHVLLKVFSTFSGNKLPIANQPRYENNPSPTRETTAANREDIIEAVTHYASASAITNRDLFVHIGDHPELLTEEAKEIFEMLVRQAKLECAQNDPRLKDLISRRDLLLDAHQAVTGGYWGTVLAKARSGG